MTDILLITDVPRLRKVFSRLNDEPNIRLRVANGLERGGEEIAAEKPDMVFVQTHLSGFSGDILLMHLKKQLGRRRTRFVLLNSTENITPEILKLYKYHLDTSLPDNELFDALRGIIKEAFNKEKKEASPLPPDTGATATEAVPADPQVQPDNESGEFIPILDDAADSFQSSSTGNREDAQQMITYSPPSKLAVYSEFTSSFDTAVSSFDQTGSEQPREVTKSDWSGFDSGTSETTSVRSKKLNFLLWLAPLLLAVVAVTMVQHRSSTSGKVDVAPGLASAPDVRSAVPAATMPSAVVTPEAIQNEQKSATKAVIPPLAEKPAKEPAPAVKKAKRPVTLPDFIPRYGLDKHYGAAHPGWERYKGEVTEFKVFREDGAIKAIQIIDRGGEGVPESFMKSVMRYVARKPDYSVKNSVKKDGYEIQRGQVNDSISAVYYRDADGGKLRAFVVTW